MTAARRLLAEALRSLADRPTPADVARAWDANDCIRAAYLYHLTVTLGYVIVHPDDVPRKRRGEEHGHVGDLIDGWNDCRRHIFGDDS